ncbi:ATP-binding cassette domain-containing protein [Pseudooceanicola aestuarii]|uniref:ATP-binding cassette domain-containing protein n=1 Tax=Pseudooceanicola aestuarii TaxID=2697319 RepID=UPI0013D57275|nr:ATP-binding cassette domain-containing protein [Pseudooceanicola aestuarii]
MSTPLLSVEGVTRRYPRPRRSLLRAQPPLVAVDGISFILKAGRTMGIVGESGSGKSTLARMVMGFEAPDAGRVLIDGQDIHALRGAALRALRPRFQMIFQDPFGSLDPRRPVGWSIAQPLRGAGQPATGEAIANALTQVGLRPADADKYPHEFSGGQRQRIAIARAVITKPALIVADEAVSALDVSVRAQILNLLMDLQEAMGVGILFISHDLAVVASLCDDLLVMRRGRVEEQGRAGAILRDPQAEYTRSLLAAARLAPRTEGPGGASGDAATATLATVRAPA